MIEKLPDNCSLTLDNFTKAFGTNAELGVEVNCTSSGKNRFQLKIDIDHVYYYVTVSFDVVTVPGIANLLNDIYPDFILKTVNFMPIKKLVDGLKIDKEILSNVILKRIKTLMNKNLKYDRDDGVKITLRPYNHWSSSEHIISSQTFKSFSEFLVWADLNVK